MRKIALPVLLCSLLTTPMFSLAASPMNPGLWEMTMQSDAMKNMPQMRNGGMTMKVCYTKEMLARDTLPGQNQSSECQPKNVRQSGNSFSTDVVCNGPNMKGTGTTAGTYSNTRFQSTSSFKGSMGGQTINHQSQVSGTWLGADCGNVKPISMPRQAK